MDKMLSFLFCFFALVLSGCTPPPIVEGKIVSSKEVGHGVTEYVVQTDNLQIPSYILKTNNHNFHQGSKIVLEFPMDSTDNPSY